MALNNDKLKSLKSFGPFTDPWGTPKLIVSYEVITVTEDSNETEIVEEIMR